ncbi:hypothetical protein ACPB2Y_16975, partial [Escherichia coli]|uniref:hypothetical protein n=2 Tax=Escherichia coli TaxID=562 RepID=UPI001BC89C8A
ADRNRSHWSTSKTPSYTKSVSWQHHLLWLCQVLPANAVTIQSFINGFYNEHPGSEINLIACRENSNALLIKI